jgi:hypothetical protein
MLLGPCALLLMEDSLLSDDSDLEDLLEDDVEQMVVPLVANELDGSRRKKRCPVSKVGRLCIP